jgi:septal ring factor EnvC (AmiA/AmiB activator)
MGEMRRHRKAGRTAMLAAGIGTTLWLAVSALAAEPEKVKTVISEQTKVEQAAAASQKRIEQLDDETSKAGAEYRRMLAEAQSLKAYNDQLAEQVKSQDTQLEDMNRQLDEIQTTSREVLPMMGKMLGALVSFVKLDIPFLPEERANRVAQLQDMMSRADVSTSEKYRRLVEAYQIEMEYGRTMEAYQGKVDGKTVEFLRAGRVSLMYQTLDGKETGYWDNDAHKWVSDDSYKAAMIAGLKVAKKQSAPDFVSVAIHAPKGAT